MPYKDKADRAAQGRRRHARLHGRAAAVAENILVDVTPALRNYRKTLVDSMPAWREEQIRKAHAAFLREKNSPNRTPITILERN